LAPLAPVPLLAPAPVLLVPALPLLVLLPHAATATAAVTATAPPNTGYETCSPSIRGDRPRRLTTDAQHGDDHTRFRRTEIVKNWDVLVAV
jgi:hypothetical protein